MLAVNLNVKLVLVASKLVLNVSIQLGLLLLPVNLSMHRLLEIKAPRGHADPINKPGGVGVVPDAKAKRIYLRVLVDDQGGPHRAQSRNFTATSAI